jgi:hypothetical protein
MIRTLTVSLLLAAAVGMPYMAKHGIKLEDFWKSDPHPAVADTMRPSELAPSPRKPGAVLYPATAPLEGMPRMSIAEVFRFDVSREWVYQRWARKSTALSELGLYGIRVPLVTGTQLHDLAGSLTYYFNDAGRVERLSFHGRTGDTTQLLMLITQRFGLARQTTPVAGEQLLQLRRGDEVISELRTHPAPVLWANAPHESFVVELVLQHPDAATPLPPRVPLAPSQPAAQQEAAKKAVAGEDASGGKAALHDQEEGWKAYFPRSRVPKQQIENLDRLERFR